MPSTREKKLLALLRAHERAGTQFTLEELAKTTGYAETSLRAYYSKKLKNFIVFRCENGKYDVCGLGPISDAQYFAHMSQKSATTGGRIKTPLAARLMERSFSAFILGVEVYNRPSLRNRVESFAIMIVNAWELLLKANLVEKHGEASIYYPDNTHSLSLRDALKRTFQDNDPVRRNLEQVESVRDDAVHLLIPPLQPHFSRLFQASVLNFVAHAESTTGRHPLDGESPGLLSLVVQGPSVDLAVIKREYGESTAARAASFLEEFEAQESSLNSDRFSVSIQYKLVLTKSNSDADLSLSSGPDGTRAAMVLHQPKDIEKLFPLRASDVIQRLSTELPDHPVNTHSFQAIVFKHKIRENAQMHYRIEAANMSLFSEAVIELVVRGARQPGWVKSARDSYAAHLSKKRELQKKEQGRLTNP